MTFEIGGRFFVKKSDVLAFEPEITGRPPKKLPTRKDKK
jgi:hypothetical protein